MELLTILGKKMAEKIYSLNEGGTFKFGKYMQDRDSKKKTPIKWIVIDKGYGGYNALIVSEEILSYRQFNKNAKKGTTWENSSLRKWLNREFMANAFSKKEQDMIANTLVDSPDNEGNSTKDKLFVFSYLEVEQYWSDDTEVDGYGIKPLSETGYACGELVAIAQNTKLVDRYSEAECSAWLRSPGENDNSMVYYQNLGGDFNSSSANVDKNGADAYAAARGVQPVLRIGPTE